MLKMFPTIFFNFTCPEQSRRLSSHQPYQHAGRSRPAAGGAGGPLPQSPLSVPSPTPTYPPPPPPFTSTPLPWLTSSARPRLRPAAGGMFRPRSDPSVRPQCHPSLTPPPTSAPLSRPTSSARPRLRTAAAGTARPRFLHPSFTLTPSPAPLPRLARRARPRLRPAAAGAACDRRRRRTLASPADGGAANGGLGLQPARAGGDRAHRAPAHHRLAAVPAHRPPGAAAGPRRLEQHRLEPAPLGGCQARGLLPRGVRGCLQPGERMWAHVRAMWRCMAACGAGGSIGVKHFGLSEYMGAVPMVVLGGAGNRDVDPRPLWMRLLWWLGKGGWGLTGTTGRAFCFPSHGLLR